MFLPTERKQFQFHASAFQLQAVISPLSAIWFHPNTFLSFLLVFGPFRLCVTTPIEKVRTTQFLSGVFLVHFFRPAIFGLSNPKPIETLYLLHHPVIFYLCDYHLHAIYFCLTFFRLILIFVEAILNCCYLSRRRSLLCRVAEGEHSETYLRGCSTRSLSNFVFSLLGFL